jgi:hypothetical protein
MEDLKETTEERKRTLQQNRALHKYCEILSETLNEAGITQSVLLKGLEVDNSPESVKAVFRALAKAKYKKNSTADLTTKEISDCYEEFNRHTSKIGIYVPWPSEDEVYYGKMLDN